MKALQRYIPSGKGVIKRAATVVFTKQATADIYVPGQPNPARVVYDRPRWWPLYAGLLGAVVGIVYMVMRVAVPQPMPVIAPVSVLPPPAPRPPVIAACVPDNVRLILSHVKDHVKVLIDDRQVFQLHYGETVNTDGTIARMFKDGPGWGQVDLTPHMPAGKHRVRIVATHEKGTTAGAVAEIQQNGKTLDVFSHPYDTHQRLGPFMDRSLLLTMNTCQEGQHERAAER